MSAGRFHPPGRLDVDSLLVATGGRLAGGVREGSWTLCTDSREMADGAIFVALRGENFDGHRFLDSVLGSWRAGALVEDLPAALPQARGPVVQVEDSLVAFGAAARVFLHDTAPPVVAITGSVGKTTTRAMLAGILSGSSPGLCAEGNFNNRIGLPLTLLGLRPEHRWVVLEMGMSEPGEIRALAQIAEPTVRVITTVTAGHLEFFDSVEGIADAKGELFEGAGPGDTLVMPAGEWFTDRLPRPQGADVVTFTTRADVAADLRLLEWKDHGLRGTWARLDLAGKLIEVDVPVAGFHQLHNALAAAGGALAMGADVAEVQRGLSEVELPGRRMRVERLGGVTILDDAYNANPASVAAALATLETASPGARRIAVLGDMLELGPSAEELHAEVGTLVAQHGVSLFVGTGPLMEHAVEAARARGVEAIGVGDSAAAGELLAGRLQPGDLLLLKGSRGMRMEAALEAIRPKEGN